MQCADSLLIGLKMKKRLHNLISVGSVHFCVRLVHFIWNSFTTSFSRCFLPILLDRVFQTVLKLRWNWVELKLIS